MGWFSPDELPLGEMGELTRALLRDLGLTGPPNDVRQPLLVLVTGLPGTGKSTVAGLAARLLGAPLIAHDWAMSGLRPFPTIQAALDSMEPPGHGLVGWSLLQALARSQLRQGSNVVLDGVARAPQVEMLRSLAQEEGAQFQVIMTECSDLTLHRSRVDGRRRDIPGWYVLDWSHVNRSRTSWDPTLPVDLKVDSSRPLSAIESVLHDHLESLG